jgi:hypothetical protein
MSIGYYATPNALHSCPLYILTGDAAINRDAPVTRSVGHLVGFLTHNH